MQPELCLRLHDLRREVMASRTQGHVVIEFSDGAEIDDVSQARFLGDGMLLLVNFPPLGPHWNSADRERAAAIIAAVLHLDLETRRARVSTSRSTELADRILSFFPDSATYLTNVRPAADLAQSPHRWASGNDLTELDAGVVIVSPELVGLVWVEDRP